MMAATDRPCAEARTLESLAIPPCPKCDGPLTFIPVKNPDSAPRILTEDGIYQLAQRAACRNCDRPHPPAPEGD